MINPGAIPQIPGDMDALRGHAPAVSGVGTAFPDTGRRVNATWQGLTGVYSAPEAGDLLVATVPVQTVSASVGEDLTAVGSALSTYATEVAAIQTRLETLRAQAAAFVQSVSSDADWRKSQSKVDEHNGLIKSVDAAVADFMDAQRRCANTILALYSAKRYTAENGDGTVTATEFGYTAAQLDGAMGEKDALPWGTAEEHDRGFWGDVGSFFGGMWDGAKGFVSGLGALIGYSDGHWSWSTAGSAWTGLGTFALALGVYSMPGGAVLDQTFGVPGLKKGQLGDTLLGAGKALIAYDEWGKDKSHAAGMATFNVVSAIIGTKGAGAGLRAGGAALEASEIATVARVGGGLVRAGEFVGNLPTVTDVVGSTLRRFPGLRIPHIDVPGVDVPTVHVDAPHPHVGAPHTPVDGPSVGDALPHAPHVDTPGTPVHVDTGGTPHVSDTGTPHVGDTSGTPHVGDTGGTPHLGDTSGTPHVGDTGGTPHLGDTSGPPHVGDTGGTPHLGDTGGPLHPEPAGGPTPGGPGGGTHPVEPGAPSSVEPTLGHPEPAGHPAADPAAAHPSDLPGGHHDGPTDPLSGHPADAPPVNPLPDGVHPGTQPDGAWIGVEHGQRLDLDPHANAAADDVLRRATSAESDITPRIRSVVDGVDGARSQGLEFALKSEDSLKRKIATDLADFPGLTPEDAAARIRDAVRYTMEIPDGGYVNGIEHAVADLRAQGFEPVTFKPTWDVPDSYKGVNSTWFDPRTGQVFELQFHTPESFAAKMATHPVYEAMRVPGVSPAELDHLQAQQAETFRVVPVPDGVGRLDDLRSSLLPHPSGPDAAVLHPTGSEAALPPPDVGPLDAAHPPVDHPYGPDTGGVDAPPPSGPAGPDPFDLLGHDEQQTLVERAVADSNPKFPLNPVNAEAMLRHGPPGTTPSVGGPGAAGSDVRFVDHTGETVLLRENKSVGGGFNAFNSALRTAAQKQLGLHGEVWVQVRPGVEVEDWIRRWQGARSAERLAAYRDVSVVFRDSDGAPLGTYTLGDRLPPR